MGPHGCPMGCQGAPGATWDHLGPLWAQGGKSWEVADGFGGPLGPGPKGNSPLGPTGPRETAP